MFTRLDRAEGRHIGPILQGYLAAELALKSMEVRSLNNFDDLGYCASLRVILSLQCIIMAGMAGWCCYTALEKGNPPTGRRGNSVVRKDTEWWGYSQTTFSQEAC